MLYQSEPTANNGVVLRVLVVVFILWVAFWAVTSIDAVVVAAPAESVAGRIS